MSEVSSAPTEAVPVMVGAPRAEVVMVTLKWDQRLSAMETWCYWSGWSTHRLSFNKATQIGGGYSPTPGNWGQAARAG